MAEPYLSKLKSIVERLCEPRETPGGIACKHFFAGAAAYVDGRIFMTLTSAGLALKLPEDERVILLGRGANPLKYFPKSPVKKEYVVLPAQLVGDRRKLSGWISRSIEFAQE